MTDQVKQKESALCPRCLKNKLHPRPPMNPVSRVADEYICEDCGIEEAMVDAGMAFLTDEIIERNERMKKRSQ